MFERTIRRVTLACLVVLLAVYVYWLFTTPMLNVAAVVASALACLLFALLGTGCVRAVFESFQGSPEIDVLRGLGRRTLRPGNIHPVLKLLCVLLISRILVYIAAYALSVYINGYQGALLDTLPIWLKGDAPHYLGIADNWYVNEGDARFHIVFFPLYPILVRLFNQVVQNTMVSGLFLSLLFTIVSGILLYELALLDMNHVAAGRAVTFMLLLPAAFLLLAPMSDSLFLMLSIACMLAARKKKYVLACLIGALAAFTRVLGVVLVVPVFIELMGDLRRIKREQGVVRNLISPFLVLLLIPMGLVFYFIINLQVTGNAFTFMRYQDQHWSQRLGWFFNTAAYQTNHFLTKFRSDPPEAFGLWLPNLLYLFGAPLVVYIAQRAKGPSAADTAAEEEEEQLNAFNFRETYRGDALLKRLTRQPYPMRASYVAYFVAYYAVSMGATWLLSAPRYLTCCFPLALALASCVRQRVAVTLAYVLLFVLQLLYLAAYVAGWPVY